MRQSAVHVPERGKPPTSPDDWMTLAEATAFLRVSRATIYRWVEQGRIVLHRFGDRTVRVRRGDLDSLAQNHDRGSPRALLKVMEQLRSSRAAVEELEQLIAKSRLPASKPPQLTKRS
jgi:excisionase family DNA binding protein